MDVTQRNVPGIPYPPVPRRALHLGQTTTSTHERRDFHVRGRLEDFVAHRLDPSEEVAFEAHLLVCDDCFTAYLVRTMDDL
jgi:hypothetical protein